MILKKYTNQIQDRKNKMMYADIKLYLADCLNQKVDSASMLNSLEVRSPFFDKNLIEYSGTINPSLKFNSNETKIIFRKSLKKILPEKILNRKKMGFTLPINSLLKNNLSYHSELLLNKDSFSYQYFDMKYINQLLDKKIDYKLWNLIMLEKWYEYNN
jgi:asparagine synthase (glutamine-hydrolysing)